MLVSRAENVSCFRGQRIAGMYGDLVFQAVDDQLWGEKPASAEQPGRKEIPGYWQAGALGDKRS